MKIGLALGGGGAKGFAHIGVLHAFKDAGIECDVVTGTSVGALVGASYAAGRLLELEEKSAKIKLVEIPKLLSPTWSKKGMFSGKNILELFGEIIPVNNIEELSIKFAAVAADLESSSTVVFSSGEISKALRASISIPAIFTPVLDGGRVLVDGGVLEPLPIAQARELGAEYIIAIDLFGNENTSESLKTQKEVFPEGINSALNYFKTLSEKFLLSSDGEGEATPHIISIIEKTLSLSQKQLTELRLKEYPPDIIISPPVANVGVLDFHQGAPVIEIGRKAAEEIIPKIKEAIGI